MNKRGFLYEQIAERYLIENNCLILGKNIYSRYGEIDILAFKDRIYYIVEVKFRKSLEDALYSINKSQMDRSLSVFYEYCERNALQYDQFYYLSFVTNGFVYQVNFGLF